MDGAAAAMQPTGGMQGGTQVAKVMEVVRQRIAARSLTQGEKLPSLRALAGTARVSVSTVVEAYERLAAEGLIRSRPGSGFYVSGPAAPLTLAEIGPRLDRAVDPLWVSRQSLDAAGGALRPGCGWLPDTWMPQPALRRAMRTVARSGKGLTDYDTALGFPALRQLLARRLAERGIMALPEQILLTGSGTQAIDLVCRFLLEPGATVLVDDPCYFNFLALLRAHQARIVSVPYTPDGPDVEAFARVLKAERPRLYITNSGVHNPTGATLSPATAHRVLTLAGQAGLTIIEDDIFADFEVAPAPRLAALAGLDRVVQLGSFSKTLSASLRCGYIVARPEWVEALTDLKIATSFGGGWLAAELVLHALKDSSYRKHLEQTRTRLGKAVIEVSGRLRNIGVEPWIEPQAGMFLWAKLPDGRDAAGIARAALAEGIVLAPGNVFSLSQSATSFLRFNVSQSQDDRVFAVLARLMRNDR